MSNKQQQNKFYIKYIISKYDIVRYVYDNNTNECLNETTYDLNGEIIENMAYSNKFNEYKLNNKNISNIEVYDMENLEKVSHCEKIILNIIESSKIIDNIIKELEKDIYYSFGYGVTFDNYGNMILRDSSELVKKGV